MLLSDCFQITLNISSGEVHATWLGMYGVESPRLVQIRSSVA